MEKLWPQTNCTISKSEHHSLVSLILHPLVQAHVTYYTATNIIPPSYSSTIVRLPVNSSFTLHITHFAHKPHPRVFPTAARTSYILFEHIWRLPSCTAQRKLFSMITTFYFLLYSRPKPLAWYMPRDPQVFLLTTSLHFFAKYPNKRSR